MKRCIENININNKHNHKGINWYTYNKVANIVIVSACPDGIPTQIKRGLFLNLLQVAKGLFILL